MKSSSTFKRSALIVLMGLLSILIFSTISAQEQTTRGAKNVTSRARTFSSVPAVSSEIKASTGQVMRGNFTGDNTTAITITSSTGNNIPQQSSPYGTAITVAGLTGEVTKVTATLNGLNHTFGSDIDIMLVAPGGDNLLVLSDIGNATEGGRPFSNATITLDDDAVDSLPADGPGAVPSGTYKPTNLANAEFTCEATDAAFPAPAPAFSADTTLADAFNGLIDAGVNGDWVLYIIDDCNIDAGSLTGGWSISITTEEVGTPTSTSTPNDPELTATAGGETLTPTSTFTETATIEATVTSTVTIEATATATVPVATATATEVASIELVGNGGFEADDAGLRAPVLDPWALKNETKDKVKCNTETKVVANSGLCAFMFKGVPGENSKIQQNLDLSALTLSVGDTLDLSAFVNAKKATASGKIKMTVKYNDTTEAQKVSLAIVTTEGYIELVGDTVTLAGTDINKIKLMVKHSTTEGKVYVDDVSVAYEAVVVSGLLALP